MADIADNMDVDELQKINVFKLQSYLNKYIKITLHNNTQEICGIVYTIDPVTENVIVLKKDEGALMMTVVMKHAIKEMTIIEEVPEALKNLQTAALFSNIPPPPALILTKDQLIHWLSLSQIPFNVVGDVIEVEGVSISPPYSPENCVSNNPTKLLRLQHLLKNIPRQVKIDATADSGT